MVPYDKKNRIYNKYCVEEQLVNRMFICGGLYITITLLWIKESSLLYH